MHISRRSTSIDRLIRVRSDCWPLFHLISISLNALAALSAPGWLAPARPRRSWIIDLINDSRTHIENVRIFSVRAQNPTFQTHTHTHTHSAETMYRLSGIEMPSMDQLITNWFGWDIVGSMAQFRTENEPFACARIKWGIKRRELPNQASMNQIFSDFRFPCASARSSQNTEYSANLPRRFICVRDGMYNCFATYQANFAGAASPASSTQIYRSANKREKTNNNKN